MNGDEELNQAVRRRQTRRQSIILTRAESVGFRWMLGHRPYQFFLCGRAVLNAVKEVLR